MTEKKRVLFVDDEPKILQGLRRMLRSKRREWKMTFAESGQEALDILDRATLKENLSILEAEYEIFSGTHAEVGAYLFGLWGLPKFIVEAAAFHHNPMECLDDKFGFNTLTAVHVANALVHETYPTEIGTRAYNRPRLFSQTGFN